MANWLVPVGRGDGRGTCVAIPHAGAGSAAVRSLGRHLESAGLDTLAVRLPGRESRISEDPYTDVDVMAHQVADELAGRVSGGPWMVYGHCSGALLALEVIRRTSIRPEVFVASSQEAPSRIRRQGAWRLDDTAFLRAVAEEGYLPESIVSDPEMVEMVAPALRADYRAFETHEWSSDSVAVPIVTVYGADEHLVREDDVTEWRAYTTGVFRSITLPLGHNMLLDGPEQVGDTLVAAWDRSRGAGSGA